MAVICPCVVGYIELSAVPDVVSRTAQPDPLHPGTNEIEPPVQISRLLEAHELILKEARTIARLAAEAGDDGTNDLVVSSVIRTNELQVWFVAEHVVDIPLVEA